MAHKITSRLLTILLCFLLLVGIVPAADAAEADIEGAMAAIIDCYTMQSTEVNLTKYNIDTDTLETVFHEMYVTGKLPWFAEVYQCVYTEGTNQVNTFKPINLDFLTYNYALYEQTATEILHATVTAGMSDWEIALSIHDYLAANFAYDTTETMRTGYDLLVNGTAVCSGYALAYMDLMNRAGVPCCYIISEAMEHGWNAVQIDGNWYFVDITWDDPIPDTQGRVLHDHFLISEELAGEQGYHSWETVVECTDTSLDSGCMWTDIDGQIPFDGEGNCYLRYKNEDHSYFITRRDLASGEETIIAELAPEALNITGGENWYYYQNRGLSFYNGRLYFSDVSKVYSCLPDGSDLTTVYTLDHDATKNYICGSFVAKGELKLSLCDHDGNMGVEVVDLGIPPEHVHSYTEEKIPSGCTTPGYTIHTCSCGLSYQTDPTLYFGHRYNSGTVIREATDSATGLKRYTCTGCGHEKDEIIPIRSASDDFSPVPIFFGIAIVLLILLLRKKKKR